MKTAIFLGAGASAAEGAPVQGKLFHNYFADAEQQGPPEMRLALATFFRRVFNIDVSNLSAEVNFPTFEEALGILDLAELRRETLRNFTLEAGGPNSIRLLRQYLVFAMAFVIWKELKGSIDIYYRDHQDPRQGLHEKLVIQLRENGSLQNTIFISTNYDILIDNALLNYQLEEVPGSSIDYGVDFTNFDVDEGIAEQWRRWKRPSASASKLYKIHGSLNWLYCPTCNTLTLTPGMKGAITIITDEAMATCRVCRSLMSPIIVPPTFYKDMSKVFLSIVWNKAEVAMREVDHIIFCGYSFPDADMHIKYLLKRIETNRDGKDLRVTVVCNHLGKSEMQKQEEKGRYSRFFGCKVNYTDSSFEEFAKQPQVFY